MTGDPRGKSWIFCTENVCVAIANEGASKEFHDETLLLRVGRWVGLFLVVSVVARCLCGVMFPSDTCVVVVSSSAMFFSRLVLCLGTRVPIAC